MPTASAAVIRAWAACATAGRSRQSGGSAREYSAGPGAVRSSSTAASWSMKSNQSKLAGASSCGRAHQAARATTTPSRIATQLNAGR